MKIAWASVVVVCVFCFQPCLSELRVVLTIFRHGNRNPTKGGSYYPGDPYAAMNYEPEGAGGLTNAGKRLSYKLGQFFRERYDEFLSPTYSKETIWFRADEVDRVVMTGELVAAGMYPPYGEQKWNPDLNWQPIPVWAPPMSTDYLYNGMFCKNFKKWRTDVEKTDPDVIKHEKENKDVYDYLSQHTGGNITQHSTFSLRQLLHAQRDIGLKLPKWTKSVFPNGKLDELAAYDVLIRTRTLKLKQLLGGVWIREWLRTVDNYLNKNDTRKAFMYAAHELTIAPILVVLDNYDNQIPSYCAALMFELHEDNNDYYVQVLYRNEGDIRVLKIPGCDDKMCPLDTFRNFVAPVIAEDPVALCGNSDDSKLAVKHQINY